MQIETIPDQGIPISRRKLRASTLIVGRLSTNRLMLPDANIMKITAITTAIIITKSWLAIPMAVMTESRENTISRSMI